MGGPAREAWPVSPAPTLWQSLARTVAGPPRLERSSRRRLPSKTHSGTGLVRGCRGKHVCPSVSRPDLRANPGALHGPGHCRRARRTGSQAATGPGQAPAQRHHLRSDSGPSRRGGVRRVLVGCDVGVLHSGPGSDVRVEGCRGRSCGDAVDIAGQRSVRHARQCADVSPCGEALAHAPCPRIHETRISGEPQSARPYPARPIQSPWCQHACLGDNYRASAHRGRLQGIPWSCISPIQVQIVDVVNGDV